MALLGIDIGGTKTSVCIGERDGRIHASRRFPTPTSEGPAACVKQAAGHIKVMLGEAGVDLDAVESVGIAAPGPVSVRDGLLLEPPNMKGWVDVRIVDLFRDALGLPVYMNNDANACALAEWLFGSHAGSSDLVYLTMSTGLGAGIICNGRVVQGATDLGGEVGHYVLDPNGPPCPCGQRGCLEIYCGGMNVANRLRDRIAGEQIETAILDEAGGDLSAIDFKAFVSAARAGDPFALEAWDEYLERLAQGIGTIIMFLNPEVILLGTIAIHTGAFLLEPLRQRVGSYAWKPSVDACLVDASALGSRIGDLSALAVAITATG